MAFWAALAGKSIDKRVIMLITEPKAFVVAQSDIDGEGLEDWAKHNNLWDSKGPVEHIVHGQSVRWEDNDWRYRDINGADIVEFAGRHCYRSWLKGREQDEYLQNLIDQGHHSVLEHVSYTFAIQGVSRTLSHELVRHRVGVAISQESQRYVDASDINFVVPPALIAHNDKVDMKTFERACEYALEEYKYLQESLSHLPKKQANEAARAVLPGCVETRLVWTANLRTLRHFFDVRGSEHADAEMQRLVEHMKTLVPGWFHE
jgi:thymidylate synthase (FAD)